MEFANFIITVTTKNNNDYSFNSFEPNFLKMDNSNLNKLTRLIA